MNPANWFGSTQPGGFAVTTYVRDSLKLGMIPFFVYENLDGTGSGFATLTANAQNAAYMQGYFTDLQAALNLVAAQTTNDTVGFVLEPEFLVAPVAKLRRSDEVRGERGRGLHRRGAGAWRPTRSSLTRSRVTSRRSIISSTRRCPARSSVGSWIRIRLDHARGEGS